MIKYKYFFKIFYNRTNKKKYNLQIWQYNVHHINIIVMKNIIILKKAREKEKLSISILDTITSAKMF